MKARVFVIIALLALTTAVVAQAQTDPWNNSFRFSSTGSTLEDELDMILGWYGNLDPARISTIEGKRLYTNLANFYNKSELQFHDISASTYLIGGKTDVFGYGHLGLLYDRYFSEYDTTISSDSVELFDTDPVPNPGYDVRRTFKKYDRKALAQGKADYYLGFARDFDGLKLGLCYLRNQRDSIWTTAGSNDIAYQNIITGQQTYVSSQKDTGRAGKEWSNNFLGLSVWKPLNDKMDVSLRLSAGFLNITEYYEKDSTWSEAYPGGDSYSTTMNWMLDQKSSGTMFGGGGAFVYKWSDIVKTRFDVQFEHQGWKPNDGAMMDYTYSDQDIIPAGSSTYIDSTYTDEISGEATANDLHFIAMNNVKWQKVEFGIGLSVWTQGYDETEIHKYAQNRTENYQFLNDPALPASYVRTRSWTETWEEKTTGSDLLLMFPVGVEFNLTKSILFRLGARHYMGYSTYTTNNVLTEGSDLITINTRYGDGTTSVGYAPNPLMRETIGESDEIVGNRSETHFTYGAGWKVTENLHLDFMGFAQLTDLTNWQLSAVFKF